MSGWSWALAAVDVARAGSAPACPAPEPPGVEVCPADGVTSRVVLLGDAGLGDTWPGGAPSPCGRDPVLTLGGACAAAVPGGVVVVLGDAVYGRKTVGAIAGASLTGRPGYGGVPPCRGERSVEACAAGLVAGTLPARLEHRQLLAELDVARQAGVPVWIVPGNHDWARGAAGVHRERALIDAYAAHHGVDVRMLPDGAGRTRFLHCGLAPDVTAVRLGGQSLVVFDSARAFRCAEAQPALGAAVWRAVAIERDAGQRVIVADHHPATGHGQHHAARRFPQDALHPDYARFVDQVWGAPEAVRDGVVLASGHEHHLEIASIEDPELGGAVQIVSGAGTAAMAHVDRWAGCDPGPVAPALSSGAGFVVVDEVDGRWEARLVDVTAPPDRAVCPVGLPSDAPPEPGVCRTSPAPLPPCPRPAGGPSPARTASQPP